MFDIKNVFASKTIWGAIAMLAPTVLGFFGVTAAETAEGIGHATSLVNDAIVAVGFVLTIWGRISATKSLRLL